MIIKDITVVNEKGKEFELEVYINTKSIMAIERDLKKLNPKYNYFNALGLIEKGEMSVVLTYVCNCVHKRGEKRPVGIDFFDDNDIDYFKYSRDLISKLAECLEDNRPTVKQEGK